MADIQTIRARVADWLQKHPLTHGVGDTQAACSVAALNLAIDAPGLLERLVNLPEKAAS